MMDIEEVFFVHTHVSIRNHHLSVELSCKVCSQLYFDHLLSETRFT